MKTQIVYSLISSASDYYLEQLMISVYSLRLYNQEVKVSVVTDLSTAQSLVGWRTCIKNMISELKVVAIPEGYNKMQCSRYLKTNLRKFITGDYLFIDTDTIISDSLAAIDSVKADIALIADCNADLILTEQATVERCKMVGFGDMKGKSYFNSGVMWVRDTNLTSLFYEEWYKQWQHSVDKGLSLDQPSMNYTNHQKGDLIKELSGSWNCQIFFEGWNCLPQAKIIHYAGGGHQEKMQKLYSLVREQGVDTPFLRSLLESPKIKFYAYLTNQMNNRKAMFLLNLYVHCNKLYHFIFGYRDEK